MSLSVPCDHYMKIQHQGGLDPTTLEISIIETLNVIQKVIFGIMIQTSDLFEEEANSGLCHFSIFDSENVSLFEKNGIFQNLCGAFGAARVF